VHTGPGDCYVQPVVGVLDSPGRGFKMRLNLVMDTQGIMIWDISGKYLKGENASEGH